MKRDAAQTIFRTVVFAGAMLGSAAGCSPKKAQTTPQPTPMSADPAAPDPNQNATPTPEGETGKTDPCAGGDPCGERPRGTDDDGGGGAGRGFILS